MLTDFAAIDFETANNYPSSICSIGIVIVRDTQITERIHRLVCPEPNWYVPYFSEQIHGIFYEDTCNAPCFSHVWKEISPSLEGLPLVAHNKAFDENVLKATHRTYCMDYPGYEFYCTYQAARKKIKKNEILNWKLPTVCDYFGIPFYNHHDALADAEACAKIALRLL